MRENFENCVAIITGAASGLGLAIAKKLSRCKVRLALFDSNEDMLLRIKAAFQGEVKIYAVDVTSEKEIKKAVDDPTAFFISIFRLKEFRFHSCT